MTDQHHPGGGFGPNSNINYGTNQSVGNNNTQSTGTSDAPATVPGPGGPSGHPYSGAQRRNGGAPPDAAELARSVFVVHGRDDQVRREMFELLRRLDLRPLEWEQLVKETGQSAPFLGDVLPVAVTHGQAALVLLTPDDVVHLHPELHGHTEPAHETGPVCQPRPNVLIELGMVLMAYPERTLIVEVGGVRPIADITGRNVIRFDGSETALGKIVERLKSAGCAVDDTGSDWRHTYPYQHLSAYHRRP
ncbi:TIR domain-containing protein [Streptomyces olivaceus]